MGDVTTWNFLETHGLLPEVDIAPEVYLWATDSNYRSSLRELLGGVRTRGRRTVRRRTGKRSDLGPELCNHALEHPVALHALWLMTSRLPDLAEHQNFYCPRLAPIVVFKKGQFS